MTLLPEAAPDPSCYSSVVNDWICVDYFRDRSDDLTTATVQHLSITISAVLLGLVLAIPLAVLARRSQRLEGWVLGLSTGLEGKTVVVQGLGNVGYHAAKFCREAGAVVVAIAEREGAIMSAKGLNEVDVFEHRRRTGSILDFAGAINIADTAAALEMDCDVLIPAALEGVFTAANAPRIKAKIILEGANGPTTPPADPIFRAKGTLVIPDIYANAGGVTVSYFEWVKNLSHVRFGRMSKRHEMANELSMLRTIEAATGKTFTDAERTQLAQGPDEEDLVNSGLEETMISAYQGLIETKESHPGVPDLRIAAFLNAIHKVARSYMELGIFP